MLSVGWHSHLHTLENTASIERLRKSFQTTPQKIRVDEVGSKNTTVNVWYNKNHKTWNVTVVTSWFSSATQDQICKAKAVRKFLNASSFLSKPENDLQEAENNGYVVVPTEAKATQSFRNPFKLQSTQSRRFHKEADTRSRSTQKFKPIEDAGGLKTELSSSESTTKSMVCKPKTKTNLIRECHFETSTELTRYIDGVLKKKPNLDKAIECYLKVNETLLSERWGIIKERDESLQFKKVDIPSEVLSTTKRLIVYIVENKYQEFLDLPEQISLYYDTLNQQRKAWVGDTIPAHEADDHNQILFYTAQVGAWLFLIRRHLTSFEADQSPAGYRADLFNIFLDIIPKAHSLRNSEVPDKFYSARPYNRKSVEKYSGYYTSGPVTDRYGTWHQGPPKVTKDELDNIELFLFLVGKHPACTNIFEVSESGSQLQLARSSLENPKAALIPSEHAQTLRLIDGKVASPYFVYNGIMRLPARTDYRAILTILIPESGELFFVPYFDHEGCTLDKLKNLVGDKRKQWVNILFISLKSESISLLNDLVGYFPNRAQLDITTPFRSLNKRQELKPDGPLWNLNHYTLMASDLNDAKGLFEFAFYECGQQFEFKLSDDISNPLLNDSLFAPYSWSTTATKAASGKLIQQGLQFSLLFNATMICPISHRSPSELVDPVFDLRGQIYEREYIELWLEKHSKDPTTNDPMTLNDLHTIPLFRNLVLSFKTVTSVQEPENVALSDRHSDQQAEDLDDNNGIPDLLIKQATIDISQKADLMDQCLVEKVTTAPEPALTYSHGDDYEDEIGMLKRQATQELQIETIP